jgi:hypothetical protein
LRVTVRSITVTGLRLALAVLVLVATGSASATAEPGTRVGQAGVTVVLPNGWHWIRLALPPWNTRNDPVTRIVVSSGSIDFGRGCNDLDYSFPSNAVALIVLEWISPALAPGLPPRPRRFTVSTLRVRAPPAVECFSGPGGSAEFRDHGRRFDAFILLGRHAPARLADRARAVLNTLKVRPNR